jgi:translation initiation factor IF-3
MPEGYEKDVKTLHRWIDAGRKQKVALLLEGRFTMQALACSQHNRNSDDSGCWQWNFKQAT